MKTLSEFLAQEKYQAIDENNKFLIDDSVALADAKSYVFNRMWRIQGQERKALVATTIIMNDTLDRIHSIVDNSQEPEQKRLVAKAIHAALSKLYEPEFYINLNEEVVFNMFTSAKQLNILNESESLEIEKAASYSTKPFENTTIEGLKAERYPPTWQPVDIVSGNNQVVTPEGDLVNATNSGMFRFTISTGGSAFKGGVSIRIYAKKADESIFLLQDSFPISINKNWESNTAYAHIFKRPAGLSGYRHFKFEFIAPYQNALESVAVEGVN